MNDFITVTTREWEYAQGCVKAVERLKERIKALEEISQYEFAKGRVDPALEMQIDDLEKIEKGEGWTDKHTKIAKESDERFKLHTKDQEVDI